MRLKYLLIAFIILLIFADSGKDEKSFTTKSGFKNENNIQKQTNALLIIDNHSATVRSLFEVDKKGDEKKIADLGKFVIKEIIIKTGLHTYVIKPGEKIKFSKANFEAKDKIFYLWDLKGSSRYIELKITKGKVELIREFKDSPSGIYHIQTQLSFLEIPETVRKTVYKLCKDLDLKAPLTDVFAEKILYKIPQAYSPEAQSLAVTFLAKKYEGANLENVILPLFEVSPFNAITETAAYYLARKGTPKLGKVYLQKLLSRWVTKQTYEKIIGAIQIVAGRAGLQALEELWSKVETDGKWWIISSLERTGWRLLWC